MVIAAINQGDPLVNVVGKLLRLDRDLLRHSALSPNWSRMPCLRSLRGAKKLQQPLHQVWEQDSACALAHEDLPSSREWMTRVRLSFEWSQLRWRPVLVDRSAAANDTPEFAFCRRPIRCPDREREPELPMPEVTKRNVDTSRPKIGRMVGQVCRVTTIRAVGTVQFCSDRARSRVNPGTPVHR